MLPEWLSILSLYEGSLYTPRMTEHNEQSRAVVYARESVLAKKNLSSPVLSTDSQIAECVQWVDRESWLLVAPPFRDDGISASRFSVKARPDWTKVMELITSGQVDVLVTWEISRATRDRPVWAALMAACQEYRVRIGVGGQVHDPDDPDDAFLLDLMAALAVRESSVTSKRVLRSVRARAAAGSPHGRHRYGYRTEYDLETGRPLRRVVDEERAEVVREVARRALAGETMWHVAKLLNDRGVPSPHGTKWSGTNLWKLITSPTYAGLRVHHGKVIGSGTWPAILTEADHNRLMVIAADPTRKTNHEGTANKHLLTGIAECGKCAGVMRARSHPDRRPESARSYCCAANYCTRRAMRPVDDLVENLLTAWLGSADVWEALAALGGDGEAMRAAEQVTTLRRRLDEHYDLAAAGQLSPTGLAKIEAKLLGEIGRVENRARPAVLPSVIWDVIGDNAAENWRQLDLLAKRAILRAVCQVIIHPGARPVFDPSLVEVRWR